MTPQEFQQKWGASRDDLVQLCGVSKETVNRWFSDRIADKRYTDRLRDVDYIFSEWARIERAYSDRPKDLKDLYEKLSKNLG